jgi:hypothetical protein
MKNHATLTPAMPCLVHAADSLHPAERFLDPLAFDLVDFVRRMAGGARIDCRAVPGVVLSHMRHAPSFHASINMRLTGEVLARQELAHFRQIQNPGHEVGRDIAAQEPVAVLADTVASQTGSSADSPATSGTKDCSRAAP